MKTVDHYLIGLKITEKFSGNISFEQEKAFLFGCIEPDLNPITYIRGSMKYQKLQGHNYQNAMNVIEKYIKILVRTAYFNVKCFYVFGKLIHYVADAFTFPHNIEFTGNIREHLIYEEKLHKKIQERLEDNEFNIRIITQNTRSLFEEFKYYHKIFIQKRKCISDDARFIIRICLYFYDSFSSIMNDENLRSAFINQKQSSLENV